MACSLRWSSPCQHYSLAEQEHGRASAARLAAIPAGESPANRDAMGRAARTMAPSSLQRINEAPHATAERLSRSLVTLEQDATLIAVIEMGQSSWLVAGIVPGVEAGRSSLICTGG